MSKTTLFIGMMSASVVLTAHAQTNIAQPIALLNPGFEYPSTTAGTLTDPPESWRAFSPQADNVAAVTTTHAHGGAQALAFRVRATTNTFMGIAQEFAVTPHYRYGFSVYAVDDETDRIQGDSFGQIHFEWRDATGKEIGRTYGPVWKADLPCKRWERFLVEGNPPEKTVTGLAVITMYCRNSGGRGTFYVDDCEFTAALQQSPCPTQTSRTRRNRLVMPPPGTNTVR